MSESGPAPAGNMGQAVDRLPYSGRGISNTPQAREGGPQQLHLKAAGTAIVSFLELLKYQVLDAAVQTHELRPSAIRLLAAMLRLVGDERMLCFADRAKLMGEARINQSAYHVAIDELKSRGFADPQTSSCWLLTAPAGQQISPEPGSGHSTHAPVLRGQFPPVPAELGLGGPSSPILTSRRFSDPAGPEPGDSAVAEFSSETSDSATTDFLPETPRSRSPASATTDFDSAIAEENSVSAHSRTPGNAGNALPALPALLQQESAIAELPASDTGDPAHPGDRARVLIDLLSGIGFDINAAMAIAGHPNCSARQIKTAVERCNDAQQRGKLKLSRQAYIRAAIEGNYRPLRKTAMMERRISHLPEHVQEQVSVTAEAEAANRALERRAEQELSRLPRAELSRLLDGAIAHNISIERSPVASVLRRRGVDSLSQSVLVRGEIYAQLMREKAGQ